MVLHQVTITLYQLHNKIQVHILPRLNYLMVSIIVFRLLKVVQVIQATMVLLVLAVLAASIFHYGTFTVGQAKARLAEAGVPVRQ